MLICLCHDNIFNMAEFWRQSGELCGSFGINLDALRDLFSFELKLLGIYIELGGISNNVVFILSWF